MKTRVIFALAIAIANSAFAQQPLHRSGTVRYPSGEPAAGVHIIFYPGGNYADDDYNYHEAITDKDGYYEILPPKKVSGMYWGPVYTTNCIMARDFERNIAAVQAFSIKTTNVDLTLQPAITLSGSVRNTEDEPVSGAEIDVEFVSIGYAPEMRPPFKANEQGQFSIPALPRGIEYWISGITAKGYGSSRAIVEAKDTQASHYKFPIFVLKHADRKLAGQVLDYDGNLIASADVRFSGLGQPQNSTTKTDSNGNFVFDAVCEGAVQLSASAFGGVSPGQGVFMTSGGGAGDKAQGGDTNIILKLYRR